MAAKTKQKPLSLLAVLFGMVVAPGETCENLLSESVPRHFITLFFLFFFILFTPPIANLLLHEREIYRPEILGAMVLIFTLTIAFFIFLERVLLFVIGVQANIFKVSAIVSYALIPLMISTLVMYTTNFAISGDIMYLTFLPSGIAVDNPVMESILPYIVTLGSLFTFIIFYQGIRSLELMYFGNAFIISILSMVCFSFALLAALTVANIVAPGSIDTFQLFNAAPEAVLNV